MDQRVLEPRQTMIELRDVSVTYSNGPEDVEALHKVSLSVEPGQFVALLGPSGCGKSTLLNVLAGFQRASGGTTRLNGTSVDGQESPVRLGYIAQVNRLFPWLTVQENIQFPLKVRGWSRQLKREKAEEWLSRVGLADFARHYPYQLSGGMQKRAALAQSLSYDPQVLLMDEPFASLDAQNRLLLQQELLQLWRASEKTVLFVTHDLVEAITLADRVIVLSSRPGRVRNQLDIPLSRPRKVFQIHEQSGYRECHQTLLRLIQAELEPGVRGGE